MTSLLRNTLLLTLVSIFNQAVAFGLVLVSDIDDTLKQTNVLDTEDAIKRTLLPSEEFKGSALTFSLLENKLSNIFYLSGSPNLLRPKLERFFFKFQFPTGPIILRKAHDLSKTIADYKFNALEKILFETSEPLILIGDDTQSDPEVYAKAKLLYPNRVALIAIRSITNRTLPDGAQSFLTSFDLALILYGQFLFTANEVNQVAQSLKTDPIPPFQFCPQNYQPKLPKNAETLAPLALNFQAKIRIFCIKKSVNR